MVRVLLALWHVVGLVLAVVLVTEYGVEAWRRLGRRLRYGRPHRPDRTAAADAYRGAEWAAGYFDEFHRAVRVDWRAYVEWWQRPVAGAFVTIDARGLRPTPGEESAAPDAVRILCFGGSTMMGMGARDAHTIPAMLARRLGELGHRVAVTNYGQLGHNTTQETITLQRLLKAGERIDIAVFYDGVNEMACAEQTGRADGLFNEANRRAEFNLLHPDRRRDLVAAAAMMVAPRTLRRLRELTGRELRGPLPAPAPDLARIDLEALARAVIETYAQNLRLIRMLGREYGFAPVFFWQPVITTKRVRSPDEQRWARDYTRDPENRTRLYRAIIDERRRRPDLAAAPDAHDLSALFDDWAEPVYIDLYHLSERGNAAVAEAMLPAVAAAVEARVAAGRGL
jgi:lysophospholipase L1-like esterase